MSLVQGEDRFAAFRHISYTRFFFARFLASFAIQIVSVSVGWQMYEQTQNTLYLGLIGLFQFLPALVLILVTGSVADRYNRRAIVSICMVISALCAAALLALTIADAFSPWPVFAILIVFRHRARLHGAGRAVTCSQSRSAAGPVECRRLEFIVLADGCYSRARRRRPALRGECRRRLFGGARLSGPVVHPRPPDRKAGSADIARSNQLVLHSRRVSVHPLGKGRARGDLTRSFRRTAWWRRGIDAGLCQRNPRAWARSDLAFYAPRRV